MRLLQSIKQTLHRPDLLSIYIANTNISFVAASAFIFIFFYINKNLYMVLNVVNVGLLVLLYAVAIIFFIQYKKYYAKILSNSQHLRKSFFQTCFTILSLKTVIIVCLLSIFFWPLEETHLDDELIGIAAAACLLVLFSSIGAAYYPFLIYDVLLISGFVTLIVAQTSQGSMASSIYWAIMFFSVYSLILGRIINNSTVRIIENQKKLKIASEKAQGAYKAKSEFLAIMSHEIRTPMNGIMGMLDFLGDTKLSKEQKEYVEAIEYCSKTLLNTLNDILDISKIEAGKLVISREKISLYDFLDKIYMVFSRNAEVKGIAFALNTAPDVPEYIVIDPNRLNQIVTNLLNNALKFTEKGRVDFDISFNLQENTIGFSIRDSGIGIRQEDQVLLFKRFSQVDGGISRKFGGTGLGLSIVYHLVKEMDGHIGVTSNPGQGSTFWFNIPYEQHLEEKHALISMEAGQYDPELLKGVNILVVDDNDLNQTIVRKYLTNAGVVVSQAKTGWEAIEKIKIQPFDLVLMDLQMPDIDGYQATKTIKSLKNGENTPILALSANVLKETLEQCYESGMVGHISKPINKDELFSKLHTALKAGDRKDSSKLYGLINKNRLSSIIEEFGPDYASSFVEDSIKEAEERLVELNLKIVNSQMDGAGAIAHDIVSIVGNIGMNMSAKTASSLEQACVNWDKELSAHIFSKLKKYVHEENKEIQKIIQI